MLHLNTSKRPHRPSGALAALVVVGVTLVAGCADRAAGDEAQRLTGSADSPVELARRVLDGLSAGDTAQLSSVRLSEREHNELVWPKLPASAPEADFPVDLAWQNIQLRNSDAQSSLTAQYAGHALSLEYVECRGDPRRFDGFLVLTDCYVGFRDGPDSVVERQLFKDVLNMDGEHKIFRYYK